MLQVRPFDIEIGQHKVMLKCCRCQRERAQCRRPRQGQKRARDHGHYSTHPGDGSRWKRSASFTEALKDLKNPVTGDVSRQPKPASLCYIKKHDGQAKAH